ncbi:UNVERIFIED_CONTAM: hypothetical protein Cloal_1948 [Acetivibrio alkalicellulosi]
MKKLNTRQLNNLLTGNSLAIEIESSSNELRAFIVFSAYVYNEEKISHNVSKFLNDTNKKNIYFWMRKYEIKKDYIENGLNVSEDKLINSVFINNIKNIDHLESELSKYLNDFSAIDVEWKFDNPI